MPSHRRRLSAGRLSTYVVLWAWAVVCAFPLYWLAMASIKSVADLDGPPTYVPFADFIPSLAAWRFILADPAETLLPSFVNSAVTGAGGALLSLLAAAASLYAMTRMAAGRFGEAVTGRTVLLPVMLVLRVVPPVVVALPLYVYAQWAGVLDSRWLLICVYAAVNLPVAVWLLAPVIGLRRTEQEEAALLDGASHARILFSVLLPMLLRPVAVTGLFLFMLCWNEYLFASYLTFQHAETLSPWMAGQLSMKEAQAGGEGEELAHMSAAAVFMAVPAIGLAFAVHRLIARSLAGRPG